MYFLLQYVLQVVNSCRVTQIVCETLTSIDSMSETVTKKLAV